MCPCRWVGAEDLIIYTSPTTQLGLINPILQLSKLSLLCLLRGKVAKLGSRPGHLASSQSPVRLCLPVLPQPPPQTTTQSRSSSHPCDTPCPADLGLSR